MTEKALAPLFTDGWRLDYRLPVVCEIHDVCMAPAAPRVDTDTWQRCFPGHFQATRCAIVFAIKKIPTAISAGGPQHAPKVRDHRYNFWNLERYITTRRPTIRRYKTMGLFLMGLLRQQAI
jgi:hypothetical protein